MMKVAPAMPSVVRKRLKGRAFPPGLGRYVPPESPPKSQTKKGGQLDVFFFEGRPEEPVASASIYKEASALEPAAKSPRPANGCGDFIFCMYIFCGAPNIILLVCGGSVILNCYDAG